MFDDSYRPSAVFTATEPVVIVTVNRDGEISTDVQPFVSGQRLAAIQPGSGYQPVGASQPATITVPSKGCLVVTVAWRDNVSDGLFTSLIGSEQGACSSG